MLTEWPRTELGSHADIQTGFPFKSANYTVDTSEIRLLRGDNIVQGAFRWDGVKYWPQAELTEKHRQYWLAESDVILAMDRPWIEAGLKTSQITSNDLPCLLVQRVARLRARKSLDQNFLRYLISSYWFTEYVKQVQTGTAVPHISPKQIASFEFHIPSMEEQKAIGRILRSLDDKIELNRQMNTTLEAMAQALFKSWFVDFDPVIDNALAAGNPIPEPLQVRAEARAALGDQRKPLPEAIRSQFPDSFVFNEEMGWVPEGWEVRPLDKIAHYQNGLALQKYRPENEDEFLPVVKIAQLRSGEADGEEKASPNITPACIIDDGDVVFSWSGSLMVDIWCGGKAALNQHLFKVTSLSYPKWFYHQFTEHHLHEFQRIAADKAVTMGHIKREHLSCAYCAAPSSKLLDTVSDIFDNLMQRGIANRVENRWLAKLRDTLLPKLLSGQLRIPDAERQLAEAL